MKPRIVVPLAGLLTLSVAGTASASWLAGAAGAAGAKATALATPTNVGSSTTSTSATITWTAPASGPTPTKYTVKRGTTVVCGHVAVLSCTETGLTPSQSYTYDVFSEVGAAPWVSVTSASTTLTTAQNLALDTTAPAPTVTAPATYVNTTTPTVSGTAATQGADATHSADATTVTVKVFSGSGTGGALLQTFDNVAVTGGAWSVSPAALSANAQYTAQVTQADGSANSGSGTLTFTVDTAAPSPGSISVNTGSGKFSGAATTQSATATASADTLTITIRVCAGRDTFTCGSPAFTGSGTANGSNGNWSVSYTGLTRGTAYTVVASQSDRAGNTGTTSANFTA